MQTPNTNPGQPERILSVSHFPIKQKQICYNPKNRQEDGICVAVLSEGKFRDTLTIQHLYLYRNLFLRYNEMAFTQARTHTWMHIFVPTHNSAYLREVTQIINTTTFIVRRSMAMVNCSIPPENSSRQDK